MRLIDRLRNTGMTIVMVIVLLILVAGVSWIGTCGIVKLICLCFGWQFKWAIATGVWLILVLLSGGFKVKIG